MDAVAITAAKAYINQYSSQALHSFESRRNKSLELFTTRRIPENGWSEMDIEMLLYHISMMDSNNFSGNCGVGEREARFASDIVARRHYRMGHGIGRSGDITEIQPKAAGSSLLNKLTNEFVLDILRSVGSPGTKKCLVVPMATGMSLMLCLRTLHNTRPNAKCIIWSRIDQKSCFKCILTAGFVPVIIDCCNVDGQLTTDVQGIQNAVEKFGAEKVLCILTTTSCFAPRAPDSLEEVASICMEYDIPHVVNNAYGIQCKSYMNLIEKASAKRVDVYVSSTDKNFMVPVGGSVIAAYDSSIIDEIGKMYPGRASATPTMDVFITLLHLGKSGYKDLLRQRDDMWKYLKSEVDKIAQHFGESIINVPSNQISLGLSLQQFQKLNPKLITEIGSMLFSKLVSGTRVLTPGETKVIGGFEFKNWGTHNSDYATSYLTAAATLGMTKSDVDLFKRRLYDVLSKVKKSVVQLHSM